MQCTGWTFINRDKPEGGVLGGLQANKAHNEFCLLLGLGRKTLWLRLEKDCGCVLKLINIVCDITVAFFSIKPDHNLFLTLTTC